MIDLSKLSDLRVLDSVTNMTNFITPVFMICVLVINGCFCLRLNWKEKREIGKTFISVTTTPSLREKRSSDHNNQLPVELDLDLNLNGSEVKLHLHRNDRIGTGVPIYVTRNGKITKLDYAPKRVSALYQDISSGASVELECLTLGDNSRRHLVRGEFYFQNKSYAVEPEDDNHFPEEFGEVKDENEDISRLKENVHSLFETKGNVEYNSDYVVPKHGLGRLPRPQRYTDDTVAMKQRQKRSIVHHELEFLSVIDYSIYEFWYNYSNQTTAEDKNTDALDNIREFYAFVLNAIDVRYQSIDSSSISIELLFAGLFIADDPSLSPWTETNKVTASPRDQVDSGVALDDFQAWLNSQTDLPDYDHAMAFTGLDLVKDGSSSNAGLAWLAGTCDHTSPTPLANSISEDHFDANMAATAAHELGHNLGSDHDGDGNGCDPNDKYVMSPSSGGITDSRASNHFLFSSCSVSQFEAYITTLDIFNNNCMFITSNDYDPDALNEYAGSMPGQVYNIDEQCEIIMGNGSYFCRGFHDSYADLCGYLYCANPDSPGSCQTATAWEGTLCGNQKWCEAGQCVINSIAPTASDSCPHGDQPGDIYSGQTCSDFLTPYPMYCYQSYFSGKCCGTCESLETGISGCLYGDRVFGCSSSYCLTMTDSELIDCCETCPTNVTTQGTTPSNTRTTPTNTGTTPSNTGTTSSNTGTTSPSNTGTTTPSNTGTTPSNTGTTPSNTGTTTPSNTGTTTPSNTGTTTPLNTRTTPSNTGTTTPSNTGTTTPSNTGTTTPSNTRTTTPSNTRTTPSNTGTTTPSNTGTTTPSNTGTTTPSNTGTTTPSNTGTTTPSNTGTTTPSNTRTTPINTRTTTPSNTVTTTPSNTGTTTPSNTRTTPSNTRTTTPSNTGTTTPSNTGTTTPSNTRTTSPSNTRTTPSNTGTITPSNTGTTTPSNTGTTTPSNAGTTTPSNTRTTTPSNTGTTPSHTGTTTPSNTGTTTPSNTRTTPSNTGTTTPSNTGTTTPSNTGTTTPSNTRTTTPSNTRTTPSNTRTITPSNTGTTTPSNTGTTTPSNTGTTTPSNTGTTTPSNTGTTTPSNTRTTPSNTGTTTPTNTGTTTTTTNTGTTTPSNTGTTTPTNTGTTTPSNTGTTTPSNTGTTTPSNTGTTPSNTGTTPPITSNTNSVTPSSATATNNQSSTSSSDNVVESFLAESWAVPALVGCGVVVVGGLSAGTVAIVKIFCVGKNAVVPFTAP